MASHIVTSYRYQDQGKRNSFVSRSKLVRAQPSELPDDQPTESDNASYILEVADLVAIVKYGGTPHPDREGEIVGSTRAVKRQM
jgi:hypothetical protein